MTKPPFIQRQERRRQLERLRANRREFEADLHAEIADLCVTMTLEKFLDIDPATKMIAPGRLQ